MEKIEYFGNISIYSREYSENIYNYSIKPKRYPDSSLISKKKIIQKLNKNKIGRDSGGENCNFSKIIHVIVQFVAFLHLCSFPSGKFVLNANIIRGNEEKWLRQIF